MGNNYMKFKYLSLTLLLNIAFMSAVPSAGAGQILNLSENIKEIILKAKPVLGKKVSQKTFNGKPILITFFASWWGSCRAEFVQLREFLNKGGTKRVNIIAINWTEERYENSSLGRLNNMVRTFHPSIRVVRSNKQIEEYFSPLTNVPMSFIFNQQGKIIYGSGKQEFLGTEKLSKILDNIRW